MLELITLNFAEFRLTLVFGKRSIKLLRFRRPFIATIMPNGRDGSEWLLSTSSMFKNAKSLTFIRCMTLHLIYVITFSAVK